MLTRLQGALGLDNLSELVLLPGQNQAFIDPYKGRDAISLVVGYNASPKGYTALDLALWIAHQTRLVTKTSVTVHAVYVIESEVNEYLGQFNLAWANQRYSSHHRSEQQCLNQPLQETLQTLETEFNNTTLAQPTPHALTTLQQACQLAKEWGGDFDTHLQFGGITTGLKAVVESEDAVLLMLGCCSKEHPIVQQLQTEVSCPVLGIPSNHASFPSS
jgi:nucleotide-binding universal stress UspA family protein